MSYYGPMDNLLAERDKLRAEVERLRAKADARAVEELTNLRNLIGGDANEGRSNGYNAACGNYVYLIGARIAELSKPAAKESKPVKLDGLVIGGVKVTKDNLKCFFDESEEPDWTVTLAAQAKNSYARTDEPVEESTARLLVMVVEGLCRLGREVRRGGA